MFHARGINTGGDGTLLRSLSDGAFGRGIGPRHPIMVQKGNKTVLLSNTELLVCLGESSFEMRVMS